MCSLNRALATWERLLGSTTNVVVDEEDQSREKRQNRKDRTCHATYSRSIQCCSAECYPDRGIRRGAGDESNPARISDETTDSAQCNKLSVVPHLSDL